MLLLMLGSTAVAQHKQENRPNAVKFEVLSIRPITRGSLYAGGPSSNTAPSPDGFRSRLSIWQMIMLAYGPSNDRDWPSIEMRKTPAWLGDFYYIQGRVSPSDLEQWQKQSAKHELLSSAMRSALEERFKLSLHEEPSKGTIFQLVVARKGPKLKLSGNGARPSRGEELPSGGVRIPSKTADGRQAWSFYGASMEDLANFLSILAGSGRTPVRDRTGLAGRYDFAIQQRPPDPDEDHVYTYPLDHLGLKVIQATEPRPILVIDHIEKPTPN